jgi:hypothetical protein
VNVGADQRRQRARQFGNIGALVIGLIVITIVTSNWVRQDETNSVPAAKLDWIASAALFGFIIIGTAIFLGSII